ncbi:hypothetical protein GCM10023205_46240 [Yinghuangia aomiensis]|uniref:Uncharacterized protein n=1 Tax=Yinghuangia aomiensis TaxID=676205 RepID=A0ABP9HMV0_9ACTN
MPRRVAYRETPRRARTLYRHSRQAFPPRTAPGRARGSPRGAGRRRPGRGTTAIHASDAAARRGTGGDEDDEEDHDVTHARGAAPPHRPAASAPAPGRVRRMSGTVPAGRVTKETM